MTKNVIVTIGRQFGSGGHEIGNLLAERLGVPLYDRNLVKMAAEELHISDDYAEEVDETGLNKFLAYYTAAPVDYSTYYMTNLEPSQPLSEQFFDAQVKIIQRLAQRSSCVIVGRCADCILQEEPGLVNVFIYADKKDRVERVMRRYTLPEKKAAEKIRKIDRERRYFYELHTGNDWGERASYQLMLNASRLEKEQAVDILEALFMAKGKELRNL